MVVSGSEDPRIQNGTENMKARSGTIKYGLSVLIVYIATNCHNSEDPHT